MVKLSLSPPEWFCIKSGTAVVVIEVAGGGGGGGGGVSGVVGGGGCKVSLSVINDNL